MNVALWKSNRTGSSVPPSSHTVCAQLSSTANNKCSTPLPLYLLLAKAQERLSQLICKTEMLDLLNYVTSEAKTEHCCVTRLFYGCVHTNSLK